MNRFSKELLEAIAKRYNEGKPELIKDDLRRISRKFGIAFADADMERRRIENQLVDEWARDRSNDKIPKIVNTGKNTPLNPQRGLKEEESSPLIPLRRGTIIDNADGAFARMRNSVNRDVKRAVDRAIKAKMPTTEAVKIIKRVLGKLRANAATIGRTAKMGKIRSDFIRKALADGIRKFRYAGPSGASGTMDGPRTFCQRNLGKVFTIEEILELNNGQGLPVLIYMGGYNCRHWWEAADEALEKENKEFDIDKIDVELATKITGAPEGSSVRVEKANQILKITVDNPIFSNYECLIYPPREKVTILVISHIMIKKEKQGLGLMTNMFRNQITECKKNGINKIKCEAVRIDESGYNGYYTWARLGFDAKLIPQEQKELEKELGKVETIQDIMKTEKGRQWWKLNGWSFDAEFDLSDNSASMMALKEYLKHKPKQNYGFGTRFNKIL